MSDEVMGAASGLPQKQLAVWCQGCKSWTFEPLCPNCNVHLRAFMTAGELVMLNAEVGRLTSTEVRNYGPAPEEGDLEYQKRIQQKVITGK